ncbi:MAG TPA: M23 family metallopeptidase [Ktedonobacterales bacterium]|nr:M23 family metallopeptidase [Ktedonobacterales bacterium]
MARKPPPDGGWYWWSLYPANLWQSFKWSRRNPSAHSGIDIGMPVGTVLVAPEDATYLNGTMEPWGGQVNLLVQWGDGPHVLSFLHLSQITPHAAGEAIAGGTLIGLSGQPPSPQYGRGAHLHFEVTHGTLAPYEGYSPTRPTQTNYPVDGASFLKLLNATGAPLSAANAPPGSGTIQQLAGSVPGFMALAQGLDDALAFQAPNDISIVGQDTGVPNPFVNIRAFLLRGFFVLLGLFLLILAFWNIIARPALEAAEPAVSGASGLASLLA